MLLQLFLSFCRLDSCIIIRSVSIVSPLAVLIDNEDQAVSFDNMVFAVETRGVRTVVLRMVFDSQSLSKYECNRQKVEFHPSDCRRAALQEIVSTIFGIMPLHRFF